MPILPPLEVLQNNDKAKTKAFVTLRMPQELRFKKYFFVINFALNPIHRLMKRNESSILQFTIFKFYLQSLVYSVKLSVFSLNDKIMSATRSHTHFFGSLCAQAKY